MRLVGLQYSYDAWGNHKVYDGNGNVTTSPTNIGNINPFRYRSYYYDQETKLYYLNSRYYDPEVGRFINADDVSYIEPNRINGLNLYAYCNNNPVMMIDNTGQFAISIFLTCLIVGAIVGGATGSVNAYNNGARGWDLVGGIALGTLTGAALGAGVGLVAGLGGAYLVGGLVSLGSKFTTDLVAYSMFGTPIGTYAVAFIFGGLTKGIAPWLKASVDIVGRPLVTQLVKMGTGRQSEFQLEKFGYDVVTRALTYYIPAPWKSFARGLTRGFWDMWKNRNSTSQYYYA